MIRNVHERKLAGEPELVGQLLDALVDRLWPADRWPALSLNRGLEVGSSGGHGFVRYAVESYEPSQAVTFRFAPGLGLDGTHRLEREGSTLRHVMECQASGPMRAMWPLVVRWLHDALLEDLLDGAEAAVAGRPVQRRSFSRRIRALRWAMAPSASRAAATAARVAAAGLLAAGAIHVSWGLGLTWPAADAGALARAVVGVGTFPSPAACLSVAALLAGGAGLVELGRRGNPAGRLGAAAVGTVLALRGLGGLVVSGVGLGAPTAPFRALDLTVYSPLCLALAWAVWRSVSTYPVAHEQQRIGRAEPAHQGA